MTQTSPKVLGLITKRPFIACGCCQRLSEGQGALTGILNERGGFIDDCIVTHAGESMSVHPPLTFVPAINFFTCTHCGSNVVINAGHEDKDLPHLRSVPRSVVWLRAHVLFGRVSVCSGGTRRPSSGMTSPSLQTLPTASWRCKDPRSVTA